MMRYNDVKDLIKDRCNLTDIILDNLMMETTLTRKVTIGLTDENDAAIVFKELHGLVLSGRKLIVEDLRKTKDSGIHFELPMAQDQTNMMQTKHALTYNESAGGNYSLSNMNMMQNTKMNYCVQPSFGNSQQQTVAPPAPDYIPFADKFKKDFYDDGKSDRYFNWKQDDQAPAPLMNDRDSRHSSFTGDGRFGQWGRPDEFARRSVSGDRRSNNSGNARNDYRSSDRDMDDRYRTADGGSSGRFQNTFDRQYDDRPARSDAPYDRSHARADDTSRFHRPGVRNNYSGPSYSGQGVRAMGQGGQGGRGGGSVGGYQNRQEPRQAFNNPGWTHKTPYGRSQDFKVNRNAPVQQPWNQPKNPQPPKVQTKADKYTALKNKDETWRGQAVSAIVKDLLIESGMHDFVKRQCLLSYAKPLVRARIDGMLGKRKAVPLTEIINEYKRRNPPVMQRSFIIDIRKKYEWSRVENGEITMEEYDETVKRLGSQVKAASKRPAPAPAQGNLPKKAKYQKKPNPNTQPTKAPPLTDILPKYPNGDKMEYKKLKRLDESEQDVYVHKLEPQLKNALDKEVEVLCYLFREECQKAENQDEQNICLRIMKTIEDFEKVMKLNISKRLLNIARNLPLRVFTDQKVNSQEVKRQLKNLGIVTFRKSMGKNKYIATCRTYEQYDHLCDQQTFIVDGQTIIFRPLHMGRPSMKKKDKVNVKQNQKSKEIGNEDVDDEIEFGDEEGAGEEFDFPEDGDDDDNFGDEFHTNDDQSDDDKKDKNSSKCDDKTNVDRIEAEVPKDLEVKTESKKEVDIEAKAHENGEAQNETQNVVTAKTEVQEVVDVTEEAQKVFDTKTAEAEVVNDVKTAEAQEANDVKTAEAQEVSDAKPGTEVKTETTVGGINTDATESTSNKKTETETVKPEQATESNRNEMQNAETVKLFADIQALSDSINSEGNLNDVDENKADKEQGGNDVESNDITEKNHANETNSDQNISQEDLEDF
ncbi:unnamed protein product, partial [Iphiclides podalirius]